MDEIVKINNIEDYSKTEEAYLSIRSHVIDAQG